MIVEDEEDNLFDFDYLSLDIDTGDKPKVDKAFSIPTSLEDIPYLAKEVYSRWIKLLNDDPKRMAAGPDWIELYASFEEWGELDEILRAYFIDSINQIVYSRLVGFVKTINETVEKERAEAKQLQLPNLFDPIAQVHTSAPKAPPPQYPCYCCSRAPVNNPGDACRLCIKDYHNE